MNNLQFSDDEDEPMTRYQQAPPVRGVAPWFAYLVGSIVAIAAAVFIVEVIRIEVAIAEVRSTVSNLKAR